MQALASDHGYCHVQRAPLGLLLGAAALGCLGAAWRAEEPTTRYACGGAAAAAAVLAATFRRLTVEDQGETLAIRFGPLPLFRKTVRYADIRSATRGRTLLLDGWGIHRSVRGGWVWNLWGRDCVAVALQGGKTLRIGTDDANNLADFLTARLAERASRDASGPQAPACPEAAPGG